MAGAPRRTISVDARDRTEGVREMKARSMVDSGFQPAMNSLFAKLGTSGRRIALAVRLIQLSMSRLEGKRGAAG